MNETHAILVPLVCAGDITDADHLHRFVMSLFPDTLSTGAPRSDGEVLWRLERSGLLITSVIPAGNAPAGARTVLLPTDFRTGQRVQFAVTLSPVTRVRDHRRPAPDPVAWFESRALGSLEDLEVASVDSRTLSRRGARLEQVTLQGTATVSDSHALTALLRHGVGREKSFGCGLLTVRRA